MVLPLRKFSFALHSSLGPAQPTLDRDFSVISGDRRYFFNRTVFASLSRTTLMTIQEDPLCDEIMIAKSKANEYSLDWVSTTLMAISNSNFDALLGLALFFQMDALFSQLSGSAAFQALTIERQLDVIKAAAEKGFDVSTAVAHVCVHLLHVRITKSLLKRMSGQVARLLAREHSLAIGVNRLEVMAGHFGVGVFDYVPFDQYWKPQTIEKSRNVNELRPRFDFVNSASRAGLVEYEYGRPFDGILKVGLQSFAIFRPARLVVGQNFGIRVSRYSIRFPDDLDSGPFSLHLFGSADNGAVLLDSRRSIQSLNQIHVFEVTDRFYHSEFHLVCSRPVELFDFFGDIGPCKPAAPSQQLRQ